MRGQPSLRNIGQHGSMPATRCSICQARSSYPSLNDTTGLSPEQIVLCVSYVSIKGYLVSNAVFCRGLSSMSVSLPVYVSGQHLRMHDGICGWRRWTMTVWMLPPKSLAPWYLWYSFTSIRYPSSHLYNHLQRIQSGPRSQRNAPGRTPKTSPTRPRNVSHS
jgi:hypothetical protein